MVAYIVMAYIAMACSSGGLYSYGLHSYRHVRLYAGLSAPLFFKKKKSVCAGEQDVLDDLQFVLDLHFTTLPTFVTPGLCSYGIYSYGL